MLGRLQVVEAISQQLATLNTNVRYLHSSIVEFAEQLVMTLPSELQVMPLVCCVLGLQDEVVTADAAARWHMSWLQCGERQACMPAQGHS